MALPMKHQLLLFTFSGAFLLSISANIEGDALHAFRSRLADPNDILQSWDPVLTNPCNWFLVSCDSNNHVIRLDLFNSNLSGSLAPELGQLEQLQYLGLDKNNINGKIPKELGNLKNLLWMHLSDNHLEGEIPKSFANLMSLIKLSLNNKKLTGPIPRELAKLSNLKDVRLNNNKLTGPIPRELVELPNLVIFNVSNNDLCGTIPLDAFTSFLGASFAKNSRLKRPETTEMVQYDIGYPRNLGTKLSYDISYLVVPCSAVYIWLKHKI